MRPTPNSARSRAHHSFCRDIYCVVEIDGISNVTEPGDSCKFLDQFLDLIETERLHKEAEQLRTEADALSTASRTARIQAGTLRKIADRFSGLEVPPRT